MAITKQINRVGVEIEGAWNDLSRVVPWFKDDCSVKLYDFPDIGKRFDGRWPELPDHLKADILANHKDIKARGEIASDPFDKQKDVKNWIEASYPDAVNESCGMHIHVSFTALKYYGALMTRDFHEFLLHALNVFGDNNLDKEPMAQNYWDRFLGKNSYCQKTFVPIGLGSYGRKYSILNYGSFGGGRKTFELRAFPAFARKETAVKATETFLKTIKDYLKDVDFSKEAVKTAIEGVRVHLPVNDPMRSEV